MPEKLDMSQLYAASLPAKNKQNLLAIYKDYISLVRNLEYVVKKYRPSNLAGYQIVRTYGEKTDENPWSVENISPEEKEAYLDFVNNKPIIGDNHYCFVSINHTSPNFKSNGNSVRFMRPTAEMRYPVARIFARPIKAHPLNLPFWIPHRLRNDPAFPVHP